MCSVEKREIQNAAPTPSKTKALKWICRLDFAEIDVEAVLRASRLPAVE
ncbi:hypothetical protein ACAX43_19295 [Paraburkholderia sp. IW21]